MTNDNIKIRVPENLREDMKILTTIVSPSRKDIGILVMGENVEQHCTEELATIRIYLMVKRGMEFVVESELEAFAFEDIKDSLLFVENLPTMSALELLLYMNQTYSEHIGDEATILQ